MAVNEPNVKTYQEFRGVDYSASPAVISEEHAQDLLNMYIGEDGILQKRPGWHILKTFQVGPDDPTRLPIHGIHFMRYAKGNGVLFIHAGTRLYGTMFAPGLRHIVDRGHDRGDPGDVPFFKYEGDVPTTADANLILRHLAGYNDGLDAWQYTNMDVNGDGLITEEDANLLMQTIVGLGATASNGVLSTSYMLVLDSASSPLVMSQQRSVSFEHDGLLYILDGEHYYVIKPQRSNNVTTGFIGESVVGYIPTSGVNGHYEYLEPKYEVTTGETIVEQLKITVGSSEHEAVFPAVAGLAGKRVLVTLIINNQYVLNASLFAPETDTITFGNATLQYDSGAVTVTTTDPRLNYHDTVSLFIKEEDSELIIAGEPGSATNPGEWKAPEKDEDRNLLNAKQINTFSADGIHKAYYLLENGCTVHKVELLLWTRCKSVNGVDTPTQEHKSDVDAGTYTDPVTGETTYYYYKYLWAEIAADHATYGWAANDANSTTTEQNAISYTTRILFTTAPEAHREGYPNIRVTYTPRSHGEEWAVTKDRGYIVKCTIVTRFGYFNDNRFWFAGNPAHRNMDMMSAVDDPTYFPNTGWTKIGSDMTAIQGYLRYGSELAIIKEDNGQDATVYMRSANVSDDGNIYFPVQQGAQGVGAISKYCLKTLKDEPLFLAKEGVYAIMGTDASQERTIPNRSFFIDKKLQPEATPACVAEVFKDYYIISNPNSGHCFVADARYQDLPHGTNDRQHGYEWFLWDNVPAKVFCATDDYLFFGTQDGRLCVFNTDWDHPKRWTDGAEFVAGSTIWHKWHPYDNGYQIHAYFVTKRDHLDSLDMKKIMLNDGGVIALRPHEQSSASITVTTEKGEWFVDHIQTDSDEPSVVIPIRRRFKNFDSIQTRIENNELREGLSILGIQYRYYLGTNRR